MLYYLKHRPLVFSWKWKASFEPQFKLLGFYCGSKGGAVVRVLPSHHCELGSNLGPGITCGLSSLLVLVLMLQGVFCGSSSFPLSAKYQHSKFQFNLAKVDGKSHPMDCPMLKSNYFFVCVYCHPCMLCHFWDQSLRIYCLGGGGDRRIFFLSHWN